MASPKHKTRTPTEKPNRNGPALTAGVPPALQEPPSDIEHTLDQSSRIALAVWLLAFVFLCSLLLWDLITAILFR